MRTAQFLGYAGRVERSSCPVFELCVCMCVCICVCIVKYVAVCRSISHGQRRPWCTQSVNYRRALPPNKLKCLHTHTHTYTQVLPDETPALLMISDKVMVPSLPPPPLLPSLTLTGEGGELLFVAKQSGCGIESLL